MSEMETEKGVDLKELDSVASKWDIKKLQKHYLLNYNQIWKDNLRSEIHEREEVNSVRPEMDIEKILK